MNTEGKLPTGSWTRSPHHFVLDGSCCHMTGITGATGAQEVKSLSCNRFEPQLSLSQTVPET